MKELPPLPKHLAGRPRDARGYPIPYSVLILADGTPDFRVVDVAKAFDAGRNRRCAACGHPMGRHVAFIGGPLSYQSRHFVDGPMHRDCALFSVQTCPHMALANARHRTSDLPHPDGMTLVTDIGSPDKPDAFFVGVTTRYRWKAAGGQVVWLAEPWESASWWRDGQPTPSPAVKESVT